MARHGWKEGLGSALTIALVVGIVGLANYLLARHFLRADLTEDRMYTIAEPTREMLAGLDDVVTIEVYFSADLPEEIRPVRQRVRDLLDEFRAYAEGDLIVEWIDPGDDPDSRRTLSMLGIPQVPVTVYGANRMETKAIYMGIVVLFEDRKEVIPTLERAGNLEYDVARAILEVLREERPVIGWMTGGDPEAGGLTFNGVKEELRRLYTVRAVDLAGDPPAVPAEIGTLVVAQPRDLGEAQARALDAHVLRGGALLVLADKVDVSLTTFQAQPIDTGLETLLDAYGVQLNGDLVVEPSSAYHSYIPLNSQLGVVAYPYPLWVSVRHFDPNNPAVNRLDAMVLPWTSSLSVVEPEGEAVAVEVLARTSPESQTQTGYFVLDPNVEVSPDPEDQASRPVAVAVLGNLPSAYPEPVSVDETPEGAGEVDALEAPEGALPDEGNGDAAVAEDASAGGGDEPAPDGGAPEDGGAAPPVRTSPETQVVVVANARFLSDQLGGGPGAGSVFVQNAVDWMAGGEQLIAIRSRVLQQRPLEEVSEERAQAIRAASTVGVPLVIALLGLGRWLYRRSRRRDLDSLLG